MQKINKFKKPLALLVVTSALWTLGIFAFNKQQEQLDEELVQIQQPSTEFSLLHIANFVHAAESGDTDTVKKYLELGMNVNSQDHNKSTALMGASLNGHQDIIDLLLANEADPFIQNSEGLSAVDFSRFQQRDEIVLALQQAGIAHRGLSSVKTSN